MKAAHFYGLIVFTTFLMGSSFAVVKLGLAYASPLLLASFRFIIAGFVMAVIIAFLKQPLPKSSTQWLQIMCIGALQTAGVMGCIFLSLRTITASESSILTFMNPLLVIIFGTLFFAQRYYTYQWIGVICGFFGVYITMGTTLQLDVGIWIGFCSAVFWAFATLLTKRWNAFLNTWVLSAYQMLIGGLLLLAASFLLEEPFFIVTATSVSLLLWLSILSSIVQFALWFYLLQQGDAGKTSSFLFLAPFFGVLTGWLIFDDPLSSKLVIGGALIVLGIYLVNRPRKSA
ncbi:MAG: DMT family transporter [Caryophanon sp.]|nr:DMT family transporter [Caryophanon sp.]